jgi:TRAP-type mannitol/chloroaromatic compound transport system permease small subunit
MRYGLILSKYVTYVKVLFSKVENRNMVTVQILSLAFYLMPIITEPLSEDCASWFGDMA